MARSSGLWFSRDCILMTWEINRQCRLPGRVRSCRPWEGRSNVNAKKQAKWVWLWWEACDSGLYTRFQDPNRKYLIIRGDLSWRNKNMCTFVYDFNVPSEVWNKPKSSVIWMCPGNHICLEVQSFIPSPLRLFSPLNAFLLGIKSKMS